MVRITLLNKVMADVPVPPLPALELTFDDIANVPVADAASVSDWNTFFDLPDYGNEFTSVEVVGDVVRLIGGSGITMREYIFSDSLYETHLRKFIDNIGCVVACESGVFAETLCTEITMPECLQIQQQVFINAENVVISMPKLTHAEGVSCFAGVVSQNEFNFPILEDVGDYCFSSCLATEYYLPSLINLGSSVLNNDVFVDIAGNAIALTIPTALMTCNGGNPDGDIQYLQANNTVTIVTI